jgi:hypothetical protein
MHPQWGHYTKVFGVSTPLPFPGDDFKGLFLPNEPIFNLCKWAIGRRKALSEHGFLPGHPGQFHVSRAPKGAQKARF